MVQKYDTTIKLMIKITTAFIHFLKRFTCNIAQWLMIITQSKTLLGIALFYSHEYSVVSQGRENISFIFYIV